MELKHRFGASLVNAAEREANYDYDAEKEVLGWIGMVMDIQVTDILELKTGVILCELINKIVPGSVKTIARKHHKLEYDANLNNYLAACRKIGVPDSDLFTILDFSDSKRDLRQVVQNLYGVGRQVQALNIPNIPKLGVTYYRSREEQLALDAKKREERAREAEYKRLKDIEDAKRGDAALERSEGRQRKTTISRLEKMLTRRHSRSRDREQGIQKRQSPENRPHEELIETHSDQVLFGMDEEQHIKMVEKYEQEHQLEVSLMDWIEETTKEAVDDLWVDTKSGRLLCRLMNKIKPGIVPRINNARRDMSEKDNITCFLRACELLGVKKADLFDTNDLSNKKNMSQVLITLNALRNAVTVLQRAQEKDRARRSQDRSQHRKSQEKAQQQQNRRSQKPQEPSSPRKQQPQQNSPRNQPQNRRSQEKPQEPISPRNKQLQQPNSPRKQQPQNQDTLVKQQTPQQKQPNTPNKQQNTQIRQPQHQNTPNKRSQQQTPKNSLQPVIPGLILTPTPTPPPSKKQQHPASPRRQSQKQNVPLSPRHQQPKQQPQQQQDTSTPKKGKSKRALSPRNNAPTKPNQQASTPAKNTPHDQYQIPPIIDLDATKEQIGVDTSRENKLESHQRLEHKHQPRSLLSSVVGLAARVTFSSGVAIGVLATHWFFFSDILIL